jgi:hypothetical protein
MKFRSQDRHSRSAIRNEITVKWAGGKEPKCKSKGLVNMCLIVSLKFHHTLEITAKAMRGEVETGDYVLDRICGIRFHCIGGY